MNFDGLTDRLRSRFFGRTSAHEEVEGQHNRASLRAGGLQGSMGSITYKDGKVQGRARGKFLGLCCPCHGAGEGRSQSS